MRFAKIHILVSIALLLLCGQAWGANCGGATPCACGDVITSSYTLTGNLACTNAGNGLNAGANNITIDLGGYTIDGDDTNTVTGIDVNGFTGVTIRNGTITDFTTDGIQFRGASTGTVEDIACNSTGNQGFQLEDTANVIFNRIVGSSNTDDGFSMHGTTVAVINTGTFNSNAEGINIIEGATLTATNITALNNSSSALFLTGVTSAVTATVTGFTANSRAICQHGAQLNLSRAYLYGYTANHVIETQLDTSPGNVNLSYSIINGIGSAKFGIAVRAGSTSTVYNCVFYDDNADGKGIFSAVDSQRVKNSIFKGLAVAYHNGTAVEQFADNCVFHGNTAKTAGVGTVTETNCLASDPVFVSNGSDFKLFGSSPARNAGTAVWTAAAYPGDAAGNMFIYGSAPDIGAYERKQYLFLDDDEMLPKKCKTTNAACYVQE